jgi:hypothetical protein
VLLLAQRYTRFKAEAARQQLLGGLNGTPEQDRLQFVQQYRHEQHAMAQLEVRL